MGGIMGKAFFCDIETTGLLATESEVITAAFIVADYDSLIVEGAKLFKFRPNFPQKWSKEAESVHKITLEEALTFPEKKSEMVKMIEWLQSFGTGAFICHAFKGNGSVFNGIRQDKGYFDWNHLFLSAFDNELHFEWRKIFNEQLIESTDTIGRLLKSQGKIKVENMKLDTLCKAFDIPLNHHCAKSDVEACFKIYKHFRRLLNDLEY
jgi:DNA polymerase III alpha subunit (gram-positive type)